MDWGLKKQTLILPKLIEQFNTISTESSAGDIFFLSKKTKLSKKSMLRNKNRIKWTKK